MLNTHATSSRFQQLTDDLSGFCDPEFDAVYGDLEREFQELRLQLSNGE